MQECIKGVGGKERVTAHPGCGPGESVALCLNILFTVDHGLTVTVRCSSGCYPSLHSLWLANLELMTHTVNC